VIAHLPNDPLPYRPINIVDVSPLKSSIAGDQVRPSRWARMQRRVLGALGVAILVALVIVGVGAASTPSVDRGFNLAPGHAMPAQLER
jgi:hypothetical protein